MLDLKDSKAPLDKMAHKAQQVLRAKMAQREQQEPKAKLVIQV